MVFIKNPGRPSQTNEVVNVTAAGAPEELDDSAVATSREGFFLVVDHDTNTTYKLTKAGGFTRGQAYTQAPKGSPLAGIVGTFNTHTGTVSPVASGFVNPTGMIYVPTDESDSDDQGGDGGDGQGDSGRGPAQQLHSGGSVAFEGGGPLWPGRGRGPDPPLHSNTLGSS